jgi:hypothetical protein
MEKKTFLVDGRELASYQLSNEELANLVRSEATSEEDKTFLMDCVLSRFEHDSCKRNGESNEDLFARQFSDFVNGKCYDMKKLAEAMACDHRYLVQEKFKVCLEYIKKLAENCDKGYFDARNEWACKTSKAIVESCREKDIWI